MPTSEQQDAFNALRQDWDLTTADAISEEEIIQLLTARVLYYLEREAEPFFQLMYRLDISEKKLNAVMNEEDVAERIARLIYERQMQKIHSRHTNKKSEPYDPELSW